MMVGVYFMQNIVKQLDAINTSVEEDLKRQKDTLDKAMADLRERMHEEQERKEKLAADMQADLERIDELKNGLR